jgi:hypothetical protein
MSFTMRRINGSTWGIISQMKYLYSRALTRNQLGERPKVMWTSMVHDTLPNTNEIPQCAPMQLSKTLLLRRMLVPERVLSALQWLFIRKEAQTSRYRRK